MDRLIKYGDRGGNVSLLLAHLNSLGYLLEVDGIFGKDTLRALNNWTGNNSTVFNVSTLVCELRLVRTELKDCTIGDLYLNELFFCNTLEDIYREKKIASETCIPYGNYDIIINLSPKYKRLMPRLLNVPNFDGILIHSGNTIKDTAGCILVGTRKENTLVNSRDAFNKLFNRLKDYSNIKIEIV